MSVRQCPALLFGDNQDNDCLLLSANISPIRHPLSTSSALGESGPLETIKSEHVTMKLYKHIKSDFDH